MADEEQRARWREYSRRYRKRHPERARASVTQWRLNHPGRKYLATRRWKEQQRDHTQD